MYKFSILFLLMCLLIVSCEKEELIPEEIKSTFNATVDGDYVQLVESDTFSSIESYVMSGPVFQSSSGQIDSVIYLMGYMIGHLISPDVVTNVTTNGPMLTVYFVRHLNSARFNSDGAISYPLFLEILGVGEHTFSKHLEEDEGVIVEWYDETGQRWTTNKRWTSTHFDIPVEPDQSESKFYIEKSVSLDIEDDSLHSQYVELKFNCNLYNAQGQVMRMEDAKFTFIFSTFFRTVSVN